MSYIALSFATIGFLLTTLCAGGQDGVAAPMSGGVESVFTSLKTSSCREATDEDDADNLSYFICPGVGGYHLQIRTVESGRLSVSVVSPAKRLSPLRYQDVVTHSMDNLDDHAEWRVRKETGKVVPIAFIVRVMAHEDRHNPEKATQGYWAVAKIAAGKACVTDSIRDGTKTVAEVRTIADSAASRPCAARLSTTPTASVH